MDDEIRKLVNKKYGPRPTSVTPVPSDQLLLALLIRVKGSQSEGLNFKAKVKPQFAKRLEKLGFKLIEGNKCWPWTGGTGDNGERPLFRKKTAYLSTIAAFDNSPYQTYSDFDVDHVCGNSLCIRPGWGHAMPNLRSIHEEAGKPTGARPRKARSKKTTKRGAAKTPSRPKDKP